MLKKYKYGIIATVIALVIILGFVFHYRRKYNETFVEHNTNEEDSTKQNITLDKTQFGYMIGTASINTCSISSVCCIVIIILILILMNNNGGANSGTDAMGF